jgi:putative nucleotidyltransferase with HDIG domain
MTRNVTANAITGVTSAPRMLVDEDLWFGSFDEDAAEKAAADSMFAVAGQIIGAKPLPESARRLAELSSKDTAHMRDMVQVLEQDPGLSAKLLKVVNSAGFGLRSPCTSIQQATTLVGTKHLHQIATTAAVLDLFDLEGQLSIRIIEHSAVVGAFCRYLGTHLALPAEELFTAGVLHDIGKLMLLDSMQDRYQSLLEDTLGQRDRLHPLERAELGFDHGLLAAQVLRKWNIPEPIPKVVAWHHEPARAYATSSVLSAMVQTLRFADLLECALTNGATPEAVSDLVKCEAASYLDISEAQLGIMWDDLVSLHAGVLAQYREGSGSQLAGEPSTNLGSQSKSGPVVKVPKNLPCVDCGQPTFGTVCVACQGYTCPTHPLDSRGWCPICAAEFASFSSVTPFPFGPGKAIAAALGLVLVSASIASFTQARGGPLQGAFVGILVAALGAAVWLAARRRHARSHFVSTRPNRTKQTADRS